MAFTLRIKFTFANAVRILVATGMALFAGCAPALRWGAPPPSVSVTIEDLRPVKGDRIGDRPGAFGVPAALHGDVHGTLRNLVGDAAARARLVRPIGFSVEKLWCSGGVARAYTEIRGRLGPIAIEVHETTRDCDEGFQRTLTQLRDLIADILAEGGVLMNISQGSRRYTTAPPGDAIAR
jgi:hypothetical protein